MDAVIIGMDPRKRSAAIEVMAADERVLGGGRFGTDAAGSAAMLAEVRRWPQRTWAIEGCQGIGRHIAVRLAAAGEQVVDVPPRLPARTRVFSAGQGRKTDVTDAHSVALAATRMTGLRQVTNDEQLEILRILADRRRSLGSDPTTGTSEKSLPGPATCDPTPPGCSIPRAAPAAFNSGRTAATVKRTVLDHGEDRLTLKRREQPPS